MGNTECFKNEKVTKLVLLISFILATGLVMGVQFTGQVQFNLTGFNLSVSEGLIFSDVSLEDDRVLFDNTALYEDSENFHSIDLRFYNTSQPQVMSLNYITEGPSTIAWNLTDIASSEDKLSIMSEGGNIVYSEENAKSLQRPDLEPTQGRSSYDFYVSSEEVAAKWTYTDEVSGFRIYRNVTESPSESIRTLDWTTAIDMNFENYEDRNGNVYQFSATDPGVTISEKYCYRITSYNDVGIESEPRPQNPMGVCVSP